MPDNQVEEIKNRLNLVDIIKGYMKIEKSGINFRGLCPFHHEKTPSFFVSPTRQLWRCFGCSIGGDMFNFIMQIEGTEFKEALSTLADKAGVQLHTYDPKVRSEKARLYEICEKACQFFEKQLASSAHGSEAKQYLLDRGITEESLTKFRVGFAPYTRNSLSEFLRSGGYSPAEIFKSGVSSENYDRFRSRIIFPIFDLNGQVIGFGGRIFFAKNEISDEKLAKYINTPQTILYDKSKVLYGIDKAKLKIRESDACILVEGYTDVIMTHQSGSENTVATSGTALTDAQLNIVLRYTQNLVTAFDMDVAGDTATKRGIDMATRKGFNIKVITLPGGKDPAEIIQKGARKWKKAASEPLSIGDFYFTSALSRFDKKTPDGRRDISNIILPMIKQIPSQIEQSFWVQKLAAEFACGEDVVWNDLANTSATHSPRWSSGEAGVSGEGAVKTKAETAPSTMPKTNRDKLYEQLLILSLKIPEHLKTLSKKDLSLFDKNFIPASIILKESKKLTQDEQDLLNEIQFHDEIFPEFSGDIDFKQEFDLCLASLKRISLKERLLKLQQEMKSSAPDETLLKKFQKVSIELAKL